MAAANFVDEDSIRSWFSKLQDTFSLSTTARTSVDRKAFEKAWRLIDKVGKLCHNSRLNLKNSPPFMLDILPDTYQHLKLIFQHYENSIHILNDCDHFKIYLENLDKKCKEVVRLFRESRDKIYDEKDSSRRKLTKLSLIFSHMLADLKAVFPSGVYIGNNFKVTKADASDFWIKSFGVR